jgi:type IX secretion system PorP/SprF family membrane protein
MKYLIILITLLITGLHAQAQLGMPLTQYSGNQTLFNPATIGMGDVLAMNLSVRKQWVQIPGSPTLMSLNAHMPMKNDRHATGIIFLREEFGPMAVNFGYLNYRYRMYFHGNYLSFGLQAGFFNSVVDWDKIDPKNPHDPTLRKGRQSNINPDVNLGLYWVTRGYYFGFSAKHLSPPKIEFEENIPASGGWRPKMATEFYLMSGYEIPLTRDWALRPEWFMRYVHHTPMAINLGLHAMFVSRYSLGMSAQTGQNTLSFSARGLVTDFLRLGYSYSVYFGAIQAAQQGSHEISLNYNINNFWEIRDENRLRPPLRSSQRPSQNNRYRPPRSRSTMWR